MQGFGQHSFASVYLLCETSCSIEQSILRWLSSQERFVRVTDC